MMEKFFALDMPASRFARNTLIVSLLGLVPLLLLYIAITPGFSDSLRGGGPALSRLVRQVLTNGLPVVFVVNWLGFFLFALLIDRKGRNQGLALVFLIDLPARIILFVLLHAVIYVVSADWFGSFGGSKLTALRVVAPTLARSALFENISGVYLYATLLSALPLYATAIERKLANIRDAPSSFGRLLRRLPLRSASVALAFAVFALFVLALTAFATALARLQAA